METFSLITVIVPVYNERNTVCEVVRRALSVPLPAGLEREIIVVDDGSTDGTDKVISSVEDSAVRVLRHPKNLGQGAAVRSALQHARGEVIVLMDADLEYDPADLPRALQSILAGNADVVLGSRFDQARRVMPFFPTLMNRSLSLFASALNATWMTDVATGFRAFNARVLLGVEIESDRFEFGPELIAKLHRRKARFIDVHVSYTRRAVKRKIGKGSRGGALRTLLKYRFRLTRITVDAPMIAGDLHADISTP